MTGKPNIVANTPPRPFPPLITGKPGADCLGTQAALKPLSCVITDTPPRTFALVASRSYT